jgi:hypothetical protein
MRSEINLYVVLALFFASCNRHIPEPDNKENIRMLIDSIVGSYSIQSQTINIPVDLNFDGVESIDLSNEFTCVAGIGNPQIRAGILFDGFFPADSLPAFNLTVHMPYTMMNTSDEIRDTGCFDVQSLLWVYALTDVNNKTFAMYKDYENGLVGRDRLHYGVIDNLYWHNNKLFITVRKRFFTPSGWIDAICQFDFIKISDDWHP